MTIFSINYTRVSQSSFGKKLFVDICGNMCALLLSFVLNCDCALRSEKSSGNVFLYGRIGIIKDNALQEKLLPLGARTFC